MTTVLLVGSPSTNEGWSQLERRGCTVVEHVHTPETGLEVGAIATSARRWAVDVVLPTSLDGMFAVRGAAALLVGGGARVACASASALRDCVDTWAFYARCRRAALRPRTCVIEAQTPLDDWKFPAVLKPRYQHCSRAPMLVTQRVPGSAFTDADAMLLQSWIEGDDIWVDVVSDAGGRIVASVPWESYDEGGESRVRTSHDVDILRTAGRVVRALGMTYASCIRLRRGHDGRLYLLAGRPGLSRWSLSQRSSAPDLAKLVVDVALERSVPISAAVFRTQDRPRRRPAAMESWRSPEPRRLVCGPGGLHAR
ncbi:MAG: hypothetical protein AAGA54_32025 [Myxococcota bacterium]